MATVSIVYQSSRGHTRALAEAVARGATSVAGTDARLIEIQPKHVIDGRWNDEATTVQLAQSDAIVFGCATYMGSVSAIYKMGMIWVGVGDPLGANWSGGTVNDVNRLGTWLGAMGQSNGDQGADLAPSQGDRITAERPGARVAGITQRLLGVGTYETERVKAR